ALAAYAALGLSLYLGGRSPDAENVLRRALSSASAEQLPVIASPATAVLALSRLAQGDTDEAEQLAQQAEAIVAMTGLQRYPGLWLTWVAQGQVLTRAGRLAEAEAVLAQGVEPHLERLRAWPLFHALALLTLVPVRHGRGQVVAARALLEEARAALRGCRDAGR